MQVSIYFSSVLILWVYELLLSRAIISRPLRSNTFARQRQMLPRHWHFMSSLGSEAWLQLERATSTCLFSMAFLRHGGHWESHRTDRQTDWRTVPRCLLVWPVAMLWFLTISLICQTPNAAFYYLHWPNTDANSLKSSVFCLQPMPAMPAMPDV